MSGRTRPDPDPQVDAAVQEVTALLRGGVPAAQAWRVLHEAGSENRRRLDGRPRVPRSVLELLRAGAPTADALAAGPGPEWRVLAAVWRLAELSGAPLVETLERFLLSMRELRRVSERRTVLLSGPRATIRLIAALPPAALLLGALLGFDPLLALAQPIGWVMLLSGVLLLAFGVCWAQVLAARLARADWVAGWEFELAVTALAGGGSMIAGLRRAVECADLARAEWIPLEAMGPGGEVSEALARAGRLGVPRAQLLLGEAEMHRDQAQAELERAAERLGVTVLVPLGVCVLPAFVLLGVAPVLIAVFRGVL
ncbi:MAG: type II secretion system F family protein [Actinobacteria bacterium]|nr:type II secretion system F family protein [Actinomycetota bacterium]